MKKIIVIILILCFIFPSVSALNKVANNEIKESDFALKEYSMKASKDENHIMDIEYKGKEVLSKNDISYKLVGSDKDISNFNRCVDITYDYVDGVLCFMGEVKKWGEYKVDIQPIIKNKLTLSKYAWWNSSWSYYRQIKINSSMVDSDLTNFPVIFNFTDSAFLDKCQVDGGDVVFVDSTNTTQFNHEINYFSASKATYTVNVTSISSFTDTIINVYYNNSECVNQDDPNSVYDDSFLAVWHMVGADKNNIDDSAQSHDIDTDYGSPLYHVDNGLDKSIYFDGDDGISTPSGDWDFVGSFTIELLIMFDEYSGDSGSLTTSESRHFNQGWSWQWSANPSNVLYEAGTNRVVEDDISDLESISTSVWHYTVIKRDASNLVEWWFDNSKAGDNTYSGTIGDDNNALGFGFLHYADFNNQFDGKIDEVRISSTERSDAWIDATGNNFLYCYDGGFYSISSEFSQSSGPACAPIDVINQSPLNNSEINYIANSLSVQINSSALFNYTIEFLNYSVSANDVSNGTYSLNYSTLNVSESFIWYVNVSNNCSNGYYFYSFNTTSSDCDCHNELMLIYNELVTLNNKDLEESDNMNVSFLSETIGIFLSLIIFFYVMYANNLTIEKKEYKILRVVISWIGFFITLATGIYFLNNQIFSLDWCIGIFFIGVAIIEVFFSLYLALETFNE